MSNQRLEFSHLFLEIVDFQVCEAFQLHIYDCLSLNVIKLETLHEADFCFFSITACTNDSDYFINVVDCDYQCFQNVSTFKRFLQLKLGTAGNNFIAVFNKVLNKLLQVECLWSAVYEGKVYDTET